MKYILSFVLLGAFAACNNANNTATKNDSTPTTVKATPIVVEETNVKAQLFMVVKDTAASEKEIGAKLGAAYGRIKACSEKCSMKMTGAPVAWFAGDKAPYIFEAGTPFASAFPKPENGIYSKEVKAGKAIVAHYYGAYEGLQKGYSAIMKYALDKKMALATAPWEIYVTDPMNEKDTAKWQTDIYFPVK